MKQCPTCNRVYTDETLTYCLDDGSTLYTSYDPQATQRLPGTRPTIPTPVTAPLFNQPGVQPLPRQSSTRWPLYLLIGVLLIGIGVGAFALLKSREQNNNSQDSSQSSTSQTSTNQNQRDASQTNENKQAATNQNSNPPPTPTAPTAAQLVGVWRANVTELGNSLEITFTVNADGTTKFFERDSRGRTGTDYGTWQYSDGILYERFSNGASGKGSVRWIDRDTFEITIIDNGVPAYSGLKRIYHRIK